MHPELDVEIARLHNVHGAFLLRYAESFGNPELARDAVQEVFLRYFMERRYGRVIESPRAWLYQVLRNHLLDGLRSSAANRQAGPDALDTLPARQCTPEEVVGHFETAHQIRASLTAREWKCLRLRAEGLSYLEIADAMQIRSGTVGALLARIQTKLEKSAISSAKKGLPELAGALRYLVRGNWAYTSI